MRGGHSARIRCRFTIPENSPQSRRAPLSSRPRPRISGVAKHPAALSPPQTAKPPSTPPTVLSRPPHPGARPQLRKTRPEPAAQPAPPTHVRTAPES